MLENWLCGSCACVKWDNLWSDMFTINFGVRQGSVLSPTTIILASDMQSIIVISDLSLPNFALRHFQNTAPCFALTLHGDHLYTFVNVVWSQHMAYNLSAFCC